MLDRINQKNPCPVFGRFPQYGKSVNTGNFWILAPQHNRFRVEQVEQITAFAHSKIRLLSSFPCTSTNVTTLHGARAEHLEEPIVEGFERAQRSARAVVENGRWPRLLLDDFKLGRAKFECLFP